MDVKLVNPFVDITPIQVTNNSQVVSDFNEFSMGGGGSLGLKADRQGLWFGSVKFVDAPFSVDMSGNVIAKSLSLIGGTIKYGKTSFTDSAHAGYYLGSEGFYVGSISDASKLKYKISDGTFDLIGTVSGRATSTIASAINSSGQATDIVNGAISTVKLALAAVTADIIAASAITETKLYTGAVTADKISSNAITSAKIMAGAIVAGKIAANAVTATEINVATLSAISANIGTVTAGTVTGVTIQTASSGARVVLTSNYYAQFYNSNGNEVGRIFGSGSGGSDFNIAATSGNYLVFDVASSSYSAYFEIGGGIKLNIGYNDATIYTHFSPYNDNSYNLGSSSLRWANLYTKTVYFNGSNYIFFDSSSRFNFNATMKTSGDVNADGSLIAGASGYIVCRSSYFYPQSITYKDGSGTNQTKTFLVV